MPYVNQNHPQAYYDLPKNAQPKLLFKHYQPALSLTVLALSKKSLRLHGAQNHLISLFSEHDCLAACLQLEDETETRLHLRLSAWERDPKQAQSAYVLAECCDADSENSLWEVIYRLFLQPKQIASGLNPRQLPKIPARGQYTQTALQKRLAFLQQETGIDVSALGQHSFDLSQLAGNVESVIGSVEVPLGIAGPLWVSGEHNDDLVYLPMATSEGALVASAIRGATTVSRSGGASARVLQQRMMRVPLLILNSLEAALFCREWLRNHFEELRAETRKYSNFARLLAVEPEVYGKSLHVRFVYETHDAAGQNMTTTCTWHACLWVLEQLKAYPQYQVENFFIEANNSSDKKISARSLVDGRGLKVVAECHLPFALIRRFLKVDAKQLVKAYQGFVHGSVASGMMGVNLNTSNMLAALFTACGQDIASVHEASVSYLQLELMPETKTVYASILLPNLVVGTVGGGTALPHQKQCLRLLGCHGADKVHRFAEIIASACLALELSTLAAIASDQFALSHEKLGRNRPVNFLKLEHFNPAFFQAGLREHFDDAQLIVHDATPLTLSSKGSSIITELTSHRVNKLVGLLPFEVRYQHAHHSTYLPQHEQPETSHGLRLMVKIKPLDQEVLVMLGGIAAQCDPELAVAYHRFQGQTSLIGCHAKELAVMAQDDPRFTAHVPTVFMTYADPAREAYVLVEEYLDPANMILMDTADDISGWTQQHREVALDGIAQIHSIWLNRTDALKDKAWMGHYPTPSRRLAMLPLWQALGRNAANDDEVITWFNQEDLAQYEAILAQMSDGWTQLDVMPKTLIHNDFNPRNIAFRRDSKQASGLRLCTYDWELATLHVPQYDLAELLAFSVTPDVSAEEISHYIDYHRCALEQASGVSFEPKIWREGYRFALYDFLINRLSMYFMAHIFRQYDFMQRVYHTCQRLIQIEEEHISD